MSDAAIHERLTAEFIAEAPVAIVITRRVKVQTDDGGWKRQNPVNLPPQTMRKIESARIGARVERLTEDGQTVVPTSTLVGLPDANVQRYDTFQLGGVPFQVVWVTKVRDWSVEADIVEHG